MVATPPCCHYFDRWCSLLLKCTSSKTKSLCTPRSLASILPLSETAFTFSPQFCIEEDSAHITSIPRCMSVKMLLENFLRLELFLRQSRMFPVCLFPDNRNMQTLNELIEFCKTSNRLFASLNRCGLSSGFCFHHHRSDFSNSAENQRRKLPDQEYMERLNEISKPCFNTLLRSSTLF